MWTPSWTLGLRLPSLSRQRWQLLWDWPGNRASGVNVERPDQTVGQHGAAEVDWDGVWRPVLAWVVGDETLLGMGLLAGHQLRLEAVPNGVAEITVIP